MENDPEHFPVPASASISPQSLYFGKTTFGILVPIRLLVEHWLSDHFIPHLVFIIIFFVCFYFSGQFVISFLATGVKLFFIKSISFFQALQLNNHVIPCQMKNSLMHPVHLVTGISFDAIADWSFTN